MGSICNHPLIFRKITGGQTRLVLFEINVDTPNSAPSPITLCFKSNYFLLLSKTKGKLKMANERAQLQASCFSLGPVSKSIHLVLLTR